MIRKVYTTADRLYQALTEGDRPIEPDLGKKPWLAALLSLLIVGAGQLYNRQLAKAAWYFVAAYVPTSIILLIYLLLWAFVDPESSPGWLVTLADYFRLIAFLVPFLFCIIWLFAVMDAYRTAVLLRAGKLGVRYGLRRQAVHMAVGFVPVVGEFVPEETVEPTIKRLTIGDMIKEEVRSQLIKRIVKRLVGFGCMFLILFLLLVGLVIGGVIVLTSGGLAMK
jgi:hypothetical protein